MKPLQQPGVAAKELGGEVILYSSDQEEIHVLNPTAQIIWELCDGDHTITDMEQVLRSNFAIPFDRDVRADIQHTLDTFAAKGLLANPPDHGSGGSY